MGKPARALNLKHLRYFLFAARHGSVTAAARALHVAPQTVSSQLQELERSTGRVLFERASGGLRLTPDGELTLEYANSIFALSEELAATLAGHAAPRRQSLRIGITDGVPKLLSAALLEPAVAGEWDRVELGCREGSFSLLLSQLVANDLDAVISEQTPPPALSATLHAHGLLDSGVSFLATPGLAKGLDKSFPACLDGAPFLSGFASHSSFAQALEAWFAQRGIAPRIVARFDDSALAKCFAQRGFGIIAVPRPIEREVIRQHALECIGRTREVRLPLFLIRPRRQRVHPLVARLERRSASP